MSNDQFPMSNDQFPMSNDLNPPLKVFEENERGWPKAGGVFKKSDFSHSFEMTLN